MRMQIKVRIRRVKKCLSKIAKKLMIDTKATKSMMRLINLSLKLKLKLLCKVKFCSQPKPEKKRKKVGLRL